MKKEIVTNIDTVKKDLESLKEIGGEDQKSKEDAQANVLQTDNVETKKQGLAQVDTAATTPRPDTSQGKLPNVYDGMSLAPQLSQIETSHPQYPQQPMMQPPM